MRLIDADALITEAFDLMDRDELLEDVPQIIKDYCDAQPTVEAIPIEFIEIRLEHLNDMIEYEMNEQGDYDGRAMHGYAELKYLLLEWRNENGKAD